MIKSHHITLILCAFIPALLFFAYQKEFIILNFSHASSPKEVKAITQKKNVSFSYWHRNQWQQETTAVLYSDSLAATMQQVVTRWTQIINEEKILKKTITVQAVLLSFDKQQLFVSFNRPPWNKESSTFEKWMMVEGLLKTINGLGSSIRKIYFLIDHQLLQDKHLDFSNAWPVEGFTVSDKN